MYPHKDILWSYVGNFTLACTTPILYKLHVGYLYFLPVNEVYIYNYGVTCMNVHAKKILFDILMLR